MYGGETPLQKGSRLQRESRYEESLGVFKETLKIARNQGDRGEEGEVLLRLSALELELLKIDEGISYSEESTRIFQSLKDPAGVFRAKILNIRGLLLRKRIERAWELLSEAEALIKSHRNKISKEDFSDFYLLRGEMWRNREDYHLAQKNFQEALRISKEIKDSYRQTLSCIQYSLLYAHKKEFDKALEYFYIVDEICDEVQCPYLHALVSETFAEILNRQKEFQKSLVVLRGSREIYKNIKNYGKEGQILLDISDTYLDMQKWDKGEGYAWQALELYKSHNDDYGRLSSLRSCLTLVYYTDKKESSSRLIKELNLSVKECKDIRDKARGYILRGILYQREQQNLSSSLESYQQAEKLYAQAGEKRETLQSLISQGAVYTSLGQYDKALEMYDKALGIRQTMPEGVEQDDRGYFHFSSLGGIWRKKGELLLIQSRLRESEKAYRLAIEYDSSKEKIYDRILGRFGLLLALLNSYQLEQAQEELGLVLGEIRQLKKPAQRGVSYNLIMTALSYSAKGQGLSSFGEFTGLSSSRQESPTRILIQKVFQDPKLVQQFLEGYKDWIQYEEEEKNKMTLGIAYMFQGFFFSAGGRKGEALDSYQKSLDIVRDLGSPSWHAVVLSYMSDFFIEDGKVEEAIKYKEEELEVYKKINGDAGLVSCHFMLAKYKEKQGLNNEALSHYDSAIKLSQKIKISRYEVQMLLYKGHTLSKMKEYQKSLDCFSQALKLMQERENLRIKALLLTFSARDYKELGQTSLAIENYYKAIELFRQAQGIFELRDVALELGQILEQEGKDQDALKVYINALNEFIALRERLPSTSGQAQLSQMTPNKTLFEKTILLLIKYQQYQSALKYMEMSRSMDLIDSVNLENLNLQDEKLKVLLDKVNDMKQKMSLLQQEIESSGDEKRKESLSGILAETRQEFFSTMNEIKSKNPDFQQLLTVRGADLLALQGILPEDSLLLEYYPSSDSLYIFVISRESFSIRKVEVERKRLYELVKEFLSFISNPPKNKGFDSKKFISDKVLLYSLLLEPVQDEISKKSHIMVIPGGLLWYLPVETLGKDENSYIIEEKNITYISSADILQLVRNRPSPGGKSNIVAFGNPTGAGLSGAEEEVRSIKSIFPGCEVFTGDQVNRQTFMNKIKKSDIIHIATHSSLNRQDINQSFIQLAGDKLYLNEVYGFSVKPASLVVLSSCQSGVGEENPGGEFASLSGAFTLSGASSVIASLWQVDDSATSILFTQFYKNIQNKKSRSESLRQAKLSLIKNPSTSNPFYWSPFILLGDGR